MKWRPLTSLPSIVIAPDLRGHGASTNPSGAFSFRQCADDLEALLDHLGIARINAIGLSGGGLVLLHMATAERSRIDSMILVSAPPYFPEQARAIQRQFSPAMVGRGKWRGCGRVTCTAPRKSSSSSRWYAAWRRTTTT